MYSLDEYKQPLAFFKFRCTSISDFLVLPPESCMHELVHLEQVQFEPLIVVYTGFDGYLRIVDLHNLVPLFLFKSNYGGFNAVAFETPTSPILALACQDDSTILLNLRTKITLRVGGHHSFVSRAIF
jgi:hypothetical protein